jgi:ferredoxin-NADP reductase
VQPTFPIRLVGSRMLAPTVRHMAFARADSAPFRFIPGQFIQIHFEHQGATLRRSYSVATLHGDPVNPAAAIEIAVSYVEGGPATQLLSTLREGDTLDASGPYGRFCLQDADTNARYLLVGTGTGVTPYRAMLPVLAGQMRERGIEVVLLFGARNEADLLYGAEFDDFADAHSGFTFMPCFSRAARTPARPHDRTGYVQAQLEALAPDPARDIAYLCGNPNMVDACFERLKASGLPINHIRREKYVSPPDPKRLGLAMANTGAG